MAPQSHRLESEPVPVKVVVLPSIANEMVTKLSSLFRLEPYLNCLGQAEHANT